MSAAPAWMNQSLTTPVMLMLSNSPVTRTPRYTTCKCNTLITSYDTATIPWQILCVFVRPISPFHNPRIHFGLQVMQHRSAGGHVYSKPDSFFCLFLCVMHFIVQMFLYFVSYLLHLVALEFNYRCSPSSMSCAGRK